MILKGLQSAAMAERKPYVHANVEKAVKEKLDQIKKKSKRPEADVVRGLLLRGVKLWNRDGVVHEEDEESVCEIAGPLAHRRRAGM